MPTNQVIAELIAADLTAIQEELYKHHPAMARQINVTHKRVQALASEAEESRLRLEAGRAVCQTYLDAVECVSCRYRLAEDVLAALNAEDMKEVKQ